MTYETNDDELRKAFEIYGEVESATVIKDRFSGKSRGFGFVEMPSDSEAQTAIDGLNGTALHGRTLTVNKARPKGERRPRRNYDGDRGSGYGGGGYGSDRGGYGGGSGSDRGGSGRGRSSYDRDKRDW